MSVKWSIIKALTCFLLVCSSTGYAQEANTITIEPRRVFRDTVIITKHDTVWLEKEKVKIDSADIRINVPAVMISVSIAIVNTGKA